MDDVKKGVDNVYLKKKHESFSGEVTYDVPRFDEYLSIVQNIRPRSSMRSQEVNLKWARVSFEIITDAGDQAKVCIKLEELEPWIWCCQWSWELRCIFSIADDNQKLFNVSWSDQGQTVAPIPTDETIERSASFSVTQFLTAAKAFGKASTLRIVLQYQALLYEQDAIEHNKKLEYPPGISGSPGLLEALHRGAQADFIISCQGQEYPVHRIVLKWASPVFCRMLETPMAEASSNKLVIMDTDSKVVQMMIDFIYKGRVDFALDNEAVSLLYCAEKYELLALKEHCLKYMKTIVSETNVTEFLSTAIKCNAGEDVKELVDWCKKRFWELSQRDEFRAFVDANLEVFYRGK